MSGADSSLLYTATERPANHGDTAVTWPCCECCAYCPIITFCFILLPVHTIMSEPENKSDFECCSFKAPWLRNHSVIKLRWQSIVSPAMTPQPREKNTAYTNATYLSPATHSQLTRKATVVHLENLQLRISPTAQFLDVLAKQRKQGTPGWVTAILFHCNRWTDMSRENALFKTVILSVGTAIWEVNDIESNVNN